jgi:hypothetical protein
MNDVDLSDYGRKTLRRWWWLALAVVLGGGVGFALFQALPPVYEARASIYVTIDSTRMPELPLDRYQYDEDIALAATEAALRASNVIEATVQQAVAAGISLDTQTFLRSMVIERRHAFWDAGFRHADPAVAQQVATLWLETAYAQLLQWQQDGTIASYVLFTPPQAAALPEAPVRGGRGQLLLAGAAAGFLIGLLLIAIVPARQP